MKSSESPGKRIAVLIPCYNEELTISAVVREFQHELPQAEIFVCDNNSTDGTAERARAAGAKVFSERRRGKGYVVQTLFRQVEADVYVLVDGDATYPANAVHGLITPIVEDRADMVVGSRLHPNSLSEFNWLNRFGNDLFAVLLTWIFRIHLTDLLSGYRAFNRNFVKNIPLFGGGFEIETELTIKALERGYGVVEIPVKLGTRPEGSHSEIRIVRDGMLILNTILALCRDYRPLTIFGGLGLILVVAGMGIGTLLMLEYFKTGLGPHIPLTILTVGLGLSGMLLIAVSLTLHTIVRRFQELEHSLSVLANQALRASGKDGRFEREIKK